MAAKVLRVKQRFAVSVFFAFVSLRPIDHRRFHPVHALSFRPSLYILVESRNREFQSGCRTAPVKQIVLEVLPLSAITFPSPPPFLNFFPSYFYIYGPHSSFNPSIFLLLNIPSLPHVSHSLANVFIFISSLLPLLFALFHVRSPLSTVVHSWPQLHFNFIFGLFPLLHLINFLCCINVQFFRSSFWHSFRLDLI